MGGPSEIICRGTLRKRPEISPSVGSRVYICMYVATAARSTFPVIFQSHCWTLAPSGIIIAYLQHGDVWADSSDGFMFDDTYLLLIGLFEDLAITFSFFTEATSNHELPRQLVGNFITSQWPPINSKRCKGTFATRCLRFSQL